MNFPLRSTFTESQRFCIDVFSLSFVYFHILISFHFFYFFSHLIVIPNPPYVCILYSFPLCDYNIVIRKDAWNDFIFFFNLPRLDLWPRMWSTLENVPCAFEKKDEIIVLGWHAFRYQFDLTGSMHCLKLVFLC